jgi:hypothetical protein
MREAQALIDQAQVESGFLCLLNRANVPTIHARGLHAHAAHVTHSTATAPMAVVVVVVVVSFILLCIGNHH